MLFFVVVSLAEERLFPVGSDYSVTGATVSLSQKNPNYFTLNGDYHSQPP